MISDMSHMTRWVADFLEGYGSGDGSAYQFMVARILRTGVCNVSLDCVIIHMSSFN